METDKTVLICLRLAYMSEGTCYDLAAAQYKADQCYRIYPKYSDTSTPYHICSNIWTSTIHYPMVCLKIAGWVANNVDPDETPRSHLGLYCLLRPVCPNTYGKYGICILTLVIPNKLICHALSNCKPIRLLNPHTEWQTVLIQIRSQLIWIYTVCKGASRAMVNRRHFKVWGVL